MLLEGRMAYFYQCQNCSAVIEVTPPNKKKAGPNRPGEFNREARGALGKRRYPSGTIHKIR
jgi:hypothetical protein